MELLQAINDFQYYISINELRMMRGGDTVEGISYNSLLYLNVVAQTPNCTASTMAKVLGITKPAVTLKVNELVRQGLLCKTQSESDGRVHYLSLSNRMNQVFALYDAVFVDISERLAVRYTPEELALFCNILRDASTHEWSNEWKGPVKP